MNERDELEMAKSKEEKVRSIYEFGWIWSWLANSYAVGFASQSLGP